MRFAYADPPYPGCAKKYLKHDSEAREVDHEQLIERLVDEFPDGWALSTKSNSLRNLLPLCPKDVRVAAWTKRYAVDFPHVWPTYAWEPVIFRGGHGTRRTRTTARDYFHGDGGRQDVKLPGAKPKAFCFWLFSLWNADRYDTLVDLYPGTGGVSIAWESYCAQMVLPLDRQ